VRLLHVVPTYLPAWRHGGPIWAVHGLASALVRRGHHVEVFTTDLHADGSLEVPLGAPVERDGVLVSYFSVAPPRRLYRSPQLSAALRRKLADCDVVHVHSLYLWPTFAAARAAERARVPYFVSPRGMLVRELVARRGRLRKSVWIWLVERRTLARAAGVVVTSAKEAAEARAFGLPLPALFEVPNGLDPGPFAAPPSGSPPPSIAAALARQPLVLYLGRLSWKKGLELLIAALPGIPAATLALVGNDEENLRPGLERLGREYSVLDRILFLGPVDMPEKVALLRGAAVLALPSVSENFGNVVLEAMAAGCPVAVTPEVGLAPVVSESGAGVVASRAEFAVALRDLLRDRARLAEMGARGLAVVAERFSWERVAERMEAVYLGALR
jgi:glycosyltransferase involved in cell wall biosynthesis